MRTGAARTTWGSASRWAGSPTTSGSRSRGCARTHGDGGVPDEPAPEPDAHRDHERGRAARRAVPGALPARARPVRAVDHRVHVLAVLQVRDRRHEDEREEARRAPAGALARGGPRAPRGPADPHERLQGRLRADPGRAHRVPRDDDEGRGGLRAGPRRLARRRPRRLTPGQVGPRRGVACEDA